MSDAKDETAEPESPEPETETLTRVKGDAEPSEAAASEAETAGPPKKKKKKQRKLAEPQAEVSEDKEPELDAAGAERPAFHAWFPRDEELGRLVRAFEVGNYAMVREQAPKLAQSSENEKVRAAARELLARIEPDPLMKYLLLAAALLLLFLAFYAYRAHGH
jgi:hypothetical protein